MININEQQPNIRENFSDINTGLTSNKFLAEDNLNLPIYNNDFSEKSTKEVFTENGWNETQQKFYNKLNLNCIKIPFEESEIDLEILAYYASNVLKSKDKQWYNSLFIFSDNNNKTKFFNYLDKFNGNKKSYLNFGERITYYYTSPFTKLSLFAEDQSSQYDYNPDFMKSSADSMKYKFVFIENPNLIYNISKYINNKTKVVDCYKPGKKEVDDLISKINNLTNQTFNSKKIFIRNLLELILKEVT